MRHVALLALERIGKTMRLLPREHRPLAKRTRAIDAPSKSPRSRIFVMNRPRVQARFGNGVADERSGGCVKMLFRHALLAKLILGPPHRVRRTAMDGKGS